MTHLHTAPFVAPALLPAIAIALTLTACGPATGITTTAAAGIGGAPLPQQPVGPVATFQQRDRDRVALLDDFAALDTTFPTQLPLHGRLTYAGHLNAGLGAHTDVIGDLDVHIDLTQDIITGQARNFSDAQNRDYAGQLELTNGSFDATPRSGEYQSQAGLRGTLFDTSGRDYAISGQLNGDLLGRAAQGYEAVLQGAVSIDGGPRQPLKGGAVALRQ